MNLREAETLAVKSIKRFLNPTYLTDENIGYVTRFILQAVTTYDASKNTQLESWIYTNSKGACLRLVRSRKQRKTKMLVTNNEQFFMDAIVQPEQESSDMSIFELIDEVLDERQRKLVRMIYVDGMSAVECAKVFGVTKQQIYNILTRIKEIVAEEFGSEEALRKELE